MRANKKDSIATWSAVGMLVLGVILTLAAFIVPSTGQVHESVLWNLWQILIFCGSIFCIVTYSKFCIDETERNNESIIDRIINRRSDKQKLDNRINYGNKE